jgi:ATP-dependent helicase/nuclease subunit B
VNLFARQGPRWFNIPAHRPFVDDLAQGLLQALADGGPEALSEATVLLPTRRGARALAEAFVKAAGGKAVLLPQIRALGDLDEGEPPFEPGDLALDLPPAISPWRRRFELAGLVAQHQDALGRSLDATAALELADALGGFFDSLQIEEVRDVGLIDALAPEALAKHWQISAEFLKIATQAWPARLEELGLIDVSQRRVALLERLAEGWTVQPPAGVMIAAGSTGSVPSTARLLTVIAGLPQGCVVLPGLDEGLSDAAWAQVGDQHPQSALRRLLATAGITREAILPWRGANTDARGRWRRRVINEALRPAEATADWRAQIARLRDEAQPGESDPIAQGLEGLSVIAARSETEAADVIALMLRETLETPGETAALVTPDLALARRVSARLARWAVSVDSSAGYPLANSPAAVLANLVASTAPEGCDPVGLLAILKHPFVRLGLDPQALATGRAALERHGLRGPRPRDWDALIARLAASEGRDAALAVEIAGQLRAALETALAPYTGELASPAEAARALTEAMQQLAADADADTGALWAGIAGEGLGGLLAALMGESQGLPAVTPAQFGELLQRLIERETVRAGAGTHARLHILGALEGRLARADRLILAGLEEGVWPQIPPVDPFLSRPMRKALGLPPPERRLGLSAHDFAQAACAPKVVLVHAERRDEAPAVKSRWLWRLETLAKGAGLNLPQPTEALQWARALDAPGAYRPAPRPKPAPPLDVRPRTLPVTGVEQWVRDPYGAYARRILHLRPLDPPDAPIEARARGTAVHAAFEAFARDVSDLGADAAAVFEALLVRELEAAGTPRARMTRELALAANVSAWVVDFERRRRAGARLLIEQEGRLTFAAGAGVFTVTAKADRIEVRERGADIIDFKTGLPPSDKQVRAGLAPQLTLTAAILQAGGFAEAGVIAPGDLVYVRVSGGRKPGEEIVRAAAAESLILAGAALEGLKARIERFDDPATPYVSWAAPQFIGKYAGDYDHLARLWEWHVIGEGEEAGE